MMFNRQPLARPALITRVAIACTSLVLVATAAFAAGRHRSPAAASADLIRCDARIKTDVRELEEDGLDILDRLRPVAFRYSRDYLKAHPELGSGEYFGVIAQQYAVVFPRFVRETGERTADDQAILGVDLQPAMIHALAAIQQLHEKVLEHEKTLLLHEQQLADMLETIGDLDNEIDAKDALQRKAVDDLEKRVKKLEEAGKPAPPQ